MAFSHDPTSDPELTTPAPENRATEPSTPPAPRAATLPEAPTTTRAVAGITLFGRYRVERELGRGGMGRVMLAFDTKLQLHVALKLIPEQLVPDRESINDLRQEVHRGMALLHPGIVRTHTFELDETGAAVVMEYIDGQTLADLREDQPGRCFDAEQLLPWLAPLCEVIDYAHREARIVHRDLKPRNVMLTRDGRLKVADFGIAATLTDTYTRHTGKDRHSGTPPYMSPQQAEGKRPHPSDDIYSLGATLYDLLTGKPPFFRGPHQAIIMQLCSVVPPTIAERREELGIKGKAPIPAAWEDTIAACLAKDPELRPASAAAVLARLRGEQTAAPPSAPPPSPVVAVPAPAASHATRSWMWAALVVAIGVSIGAWLLQTHAARRAEQLRSEVISPEDRQTLAHARTLLETRQFDEATALLDRFPDDHPAAATLRAAIFAQRDEAILRAAQSRREAIAALLARADAAIQSADWPGARNAVNEIIKTHDPQHEEAWAKLKRLDEQQKSSDESRALAFFSLACENAEEAIAAGEFDRAEKLLADIAPAYATLPKVADLRQRLAAARTAAEKARVIAAARPPAKATPGGRSSTGKASTKSKPTNPVAAKATPPKASGPAPTKPVTSRTPPKPTPRPKPTYRNFLTM